MYSISSLFWIYQSWHLKYIRASARIWIENRRLQRSFKKMSPMLLADISKQLILLDVRSSKRGHEQFHRHNLKFQVEIY